MMTSMPFQGSLSLEVSHIISLALSIGYVIFIYSFTDPQLNKLDRNDVRVVTSRIIKISIFSTMVVLLLPLLLSYLASVGHLKIMSQLGLIPGLESDGSFDLVKLIQSLKDIGSNLTLILILFIGPILDMILIDGENPIFSYIEEIQTIHGIRDLFVGPLTEELIYTASIIVTLLQVSPSVSLKVLVLLPPLFFSIAHFHHAYQLHLKGHAIVPIIVSTLFQLTYTFLFGIFTNFVFLRNGNLWSCFLLHSFCNFMSVPKIKVQGKCWGFVYYGLLVCGVVMFWKGLYFFTESDNSMIDW